MNIKFEDDFPFIEMTILNDSQSIKLTNVLVDICASTTMLSTDKALEIGIKPEPFDLIKKGFINDNECVYEKTIDQLIVNGIVLNNVKVDIGSFEDFETIDAVLGLDLLIPLKAVIDLDKKVLIMKGDANDYEGATG